ncbi:hypothetical protein [Streptomyces fractus]|uniref:hypothetical protein n=1 Tax=Streptomyces fractus TaxID=641806 RepID=UPI003CEE7A4F
MTPQERLAAELIPTGTFGHATPTRPAQGRVRHGPTWTPEEQTQHCQDLLDGIAGWAYVEPEDNKPHLVVVDGEAA